MTFHIEYTKPLQHTNDEYYFEFSTLFAFHYLHSIYTSTDGIKRKLEPDILFIA